MEFKKLSSVETVETANDKAKVLIEQDGSIKRVSKDEVGGIKIASTAEVGQVIAVKAVDEHGKPTEWECVDTADSWNDLKDKPFWVDEKKTLVVEGMSDDGLYLVESQLEEGKEYVYCIDGIDYTGKAYLEAGEIYANLEDSQGNTVCIVYDYGNIVLSREYFDFSVPHKIELVEKRVIHKLDAKYLPDPFWVEEKKTLVVEGVSDGGSYNVQSQLEVGKEYTYCIDGVEYSGECYQGDVDITIQLFPIGEQVTYCHAHVYEYGINLSDTNFDLSVSHKIELVERVYHTHHDFMIIAEFNDETGEGSAKVVAGNFAAAKAKILKGLQATAYVCSTAYGDGWKEVENFIDTLFYAQNPEEEFCVLRDIGIGILPDNTIG